jgi:putative addiction module component (TIGR02574 family)
MGDGARKLLEEVLRLPESEREELATALLASFDGDADEDWLDAWDREISDRLADLQANPQTSVPWELVRERLRRTLARP